MVRPLQLALVLLRTAEEPGPAAWPGWWSSQRALMAGVPCGVLRHGHQSGQCAPGPPHDGGDRLRSRTLAVSATDSLCRICVLAGVDDQGVATHVCDAGGKRNPGAGGGLVEDDRHCFSASSLRGERLDTVRGSLHAQGKVQDFRLLRTREISVLEKVACCCCGHRVSFALWRMAGNAVRNWSGLVRGEDQGRGQPDGVRGGTV